MIKNAAENRYFKNNGQPTDKPLHTQNKNRGNDVFKPFPLLKEWQGQKDSNPRHAVLETAALPTELYPYTLFNFV